MSPALLVSEQHAHWDVLALPPSAVAAWDETVTQSAGSVSPSSQGGESSILHSPSLASSPFEYQRAVIHAVWLPIAKSRSSERNNPRSAELALEQIRALHRKQETRRREQAEAEWIAANRGFYAGHWVALLGPDLIAAGDSARAVAQAAAGAPSTPLIVYLDRELPFAGW
jgi:hypothetical protein